MRQGAAAHAGAMSLTDFPITYHERRRVAASDRISQPETTFLVARSVDHAMVFSSAFFAICRGPDRGGRIKFDDDLLCEAGMALKANFSVDEAWGGLYSALKGESPAFSKQNCVGISFDESPGDRLRVSLWLIIPGHRA